MNEARSDRNEEIANMVETIYRSAREERELLSEKVGCEGYSIRAVEARLEDVVKLETMEYYAKLLHRVANKEGTDLYGALPAVVERLRDTLVEERTFSSTSVVSNAIGSLRQKAIQEILSFGGFAMLARPL